MVVGVLALREGLSPGESGVDGEEAFEGEDGQLEEVEGELEFEIKVGITGSWGERIRFKSPSPASYMTEAAAALLNFIIYELKDARASESILVDRSSKV